MIRIVDRPSFGPVVNRREPSGVQDTATSYFSTPGTGANPSIPSVVDRFPLRSVNLFWETGFLGDENCFAEAISHPFQFRRSPSPEVNALRTIVPMSPRPCAVRMLTSSGAVNNVGIQNPGNGSDLLRREGIEKQFAGLS